MKYFFLFPVLWSVSVLIAQQDTILQLEQYVIRKGSGIEPYFSDIIRTSDNEKYLVYISVKKKQNRHYLILSVKEAVIGIPKDMLKRTFGIIHLKKRSFYLIKPDNADDIRFMNDMLNKFFDVLGKETVQEKIFVNLNGKNREIDKLKNYQIVIHRTFIPYEGEKREFIVVSMIVNFGDAVIFDF